MEPNTEVEFDLPKEEPPANGLFEEVFEPKTFDVDLLPNGLLVFDPKVLPPPKVFELEPPAKGFDDFDLENALFEDELLLLPLANGLFDFDPPPPNGLELLANLLLEL